MTAETSDSALTIRYDGTARHVAGIEAINTLLTVLSLGIYRFWAKTRLRRYFWTRIVLAEDSIRYSGRGIELFIGFLIAIVALFIFSGAYTLFEIAFRTAFEIGGNSTLGALAYLGAPGPLDVVYVFLILWLIDFARFRARRYRLSRTDWRGIRAGQTGSAGKYAWRAFFYRFLVGATLGLAYPVARAGLQSYRTNNTWLGDRRFRADLAGRPLMGRWITCWALLPFTLGLSLLWYRAAEYNAFARRTRYETLRFAANLTWGSLLRIYVPFLLVIVLFGLAYFPIVAVSGLSGLAGSLFPTLLALSAFILVPVLYTVMVTHRLAALLCERTRISGDVDVAAIAQSNRERPAIGEGLADALDIGGL